MFIPHRISLTACMKTKEQDCYRVTQKPWYALPTKCSACTGRSKQLPMPPKEVKLSL